MKTCIFLTMRYENSRLQLKHFKGIGDQTAADYLIERLKKTSLPIIICSPGTRENAEYIKAIANWHDIGFYAGDERNIIKRHYMCALTNDAENIINVDGDDVLICPETILDVKDLLSLPQIDIVATQNLPLGLNVIGYSRKAINDIYYDNDTNWGQQILNKPHVSIDYKKQRDYRLTMDYAEDFELIKTIALNCKNNITVDGIIEYLDANKEITLLNSFRNTEYYQRIETLGSK